MVPNQAVGDFIHTQRQDYVNKVVYSWEGLGFSQRDTLRQTDFYKSSKFMDGDYDDDGNALLFNNIVNAAAETAKAYQDIDSKDLTLRTTDGNYTMSLLINQENNKLKQEMRIGSVVNDLIDVRVDYGGAFLRKRMHKDKMTLEVPAWKDIICNPEDWRRSPIIQRSVQTPSGILDKKGVWRNVDEIMEKYYQHRAGELGANLPAQINIYEIFGHLPTEFGKDKPKESETYEDKVVIAVGFKTVETNTVDNITEYQFVDCYIPVFDGPMEMPFKYLPYKKMAGRTLGQGVIESGFHAQIAINRVVYDQMIAMSVAGKIVLQTASDEIDADSIAHVPSGTILRHEVNKPITNLNVTPTALPQFNVMIEQWQEQFRTVSGNNSFVGGGNLPSQTPFKLAEFQNDIGTNVFKKRQEEMDLFLQEVYDDWIIPYLVKKINKKHILEGEFSKDELDRIDESFAVKQLDKQIAQYIQRTGRPPTEDEVDRAYDELVRKQRLNKNRRYLDIPDDYFKDAQLKMELNVTNETVEKDAMVASLTNMFQVLVQNPMALQDEQLSSLLNEILEFVGINPMKVASQTPKRDNSLAAQVGPLSGSGSAAVANALNQ